MWLTLCKERSSSSTHLLIKHCSEQHLKMFHFNCYFLPGKMEAELEKMRETNGPLSSSSESEEEENSLDIGADICIDDLSGRDNL